MTPCRAQEIATRAKQAFREHGAPFTMNFEQGSAFGSKEYVFLLASKGISQSMDERARWKDNALAKRWFQTFKGECLKADKIQHATRA